MENENDIFDQIQQMEIVLSKHVDLFNVTCF